MGKEEWKDKRHPKVFLERLKAHSEREDQCLGGRAPAT